MALTHPCICSYGYIPRSMETQETVDISFLPNLSPMAPSRSGSHIQVKATWSLSAVAFIRSYPSWPWAPAEAWKLMQGHAEQSLGGQGYKTERQGTELAGTKEGGCTLMLHPGKHLVQQDMGSWMEKRGGRG